jgi:hypothetical protein
MTTAFTGRSARTMTHGRVVLRDRNHERQVHIVRGHRAAERSADTPRSREYDFEAPPDEVSNDGEKAVDLVMNAQQGVCRRAGCWWYSRSRCRKFRGQGQLVATTSGKLRFGAQRGMTPPWWSL